MKKRKFLVVLLVCSMILYQHTLCSAATPAWEIVVGESVDENGSTVSDTVSEEKEKLPFKTYMEQYPERLTDAEHWESADGGYHCPVSMEELKEIGSGDLDTWGERSALCQIPAEILESVNTADLLSLVFEYPYLTEIRYSDSFVDGIKFYAGEFNGLYELLNRSDFYETVVSYYDNLDIPLYQRNHLDDILPEDPTEEDYNEISDEEHKKAAYDNRMQMIINVCIAMLSGMTENIQEDVLQNAKSVLDKKYLEIENSEYNDGGVINKDSLQSASWTDKEVVGNADNTLYSQKSASVLRTKGGIEVNYTKAKTISSISQDAKDNAKDKYSAWDTSTGEQLVKLVDGGGTTGFNCHNYAWLYYDKEYKSTYWKKGFINSITDSYLRDSKYGDSGQEALSKYQIGANGNTHSVVLVKREVEYRLSNGMVSKSPLVISKWGSSGVLIQHPLKLMPSEYQGTYIFYC